MVGFNVDPKSAAYSKYHCHSLDYQAIFDKSTTQLGEPTGVTCTLALFYFLEGSVSCWILSLVQRMLIILSERFLCRLCQRKGLIEVHDCSSSPRMFQKVKKMIVYNPHGVFAGGLQNHALQ